MPKNKTSTIETILSKFDEKFMMPEWEDFPEMKAFLLQALKTVQDQTREEIADNMQQYYIEWRHQVNDLYEKGRRTKEPQVLLGFPTWLEDELKEKK